MHIHYFTHAHAISVSWGVHHNPTNNSPEREEMWTSEIQEQKEAMLGLSQQHFGISSHQFTKATSSCPPLIAMRSAEPAPQKLYTQSTSRTKSPAIVSTANSKVCSV